MPLRDKPSNTRPLGITAGRLTPQANTLQSDTASKVAGLTQNFSLSENLKEKRMPLSDSSNTSIYAYVSLRNFASFNWRVTNTNIESEPLYCYLYGSTNGNPGVENKGAVELIQRVEANEHMNINVPVRSHYYRAEYAIANAANVSVVANVSTIPFQVYSNDQPIYKTFEQYDIAGLVRPASRFESDIVRQNFLGSALTNRNTLITSVSNTSAQAAWDTTDDYWRLNQAYPLLIQGTTVADNGLTIFLSGLDNNGEYQSELVWLADALAGATTSLSFWKVNFASVVFPQIPGVQYFNNGDISIGYDDGISVYAQEFIPAGAGQSSSIKYSVPSGKEVVVRDLTIKGLLDASFELRVFKWDSLSANALRYETLSINGLSQGNDLTTFPLNMYLTQNSEFVVGVFANSGTTNSVSLSASWEEYDNQHAVENPI